MSICAAQLLGQRLSHVMLLAIEVAVEFWLSLQWTPQAQIMKEAGHHSSLAEEARPGCHSALCLVDCCAAFCLLQQTSHQARSSPARQLPVQTNASLLAIDTAFVGCSHSAQPELRLVRWTQLGSLLRVTVCTGEAAEQASVDLHRGQGGGGACPLQGHSDLPCCSGRSSPAGALSGYLEEPACLMSFWVSYGHSIEL